MHCQQATLPRIGEGIVAAIVRHLPVPSTANSTPLRVLEKCSPEDLSCQDNKQRSVFQKLFRSCRLRLPKSIFREERFD